MALRINQSILFNTHICHHEQPCIIKANQMCCTIGPELDDSRRWQTIRCHFKIKEYGALPRTYHCQRAHIIFENLWIILLYLLPLHGGVVASTGASQQEGRRFNSRSGRSFCVEAACSPRGSVGSLRVLRLPPTVQRHAVRLIDVWIAHRCECESEWLSVSIWALDGLAACPGCPLPSPYVSWDQLQRPATLIRMKRYW